ncbi:MAG TPA: hypothetical protein O0X97_02225 [Methanocorpusculum sp.]|nr:hypothetical protein [Methanocorpusculum sp.]
MARSKTNPSSSVTFRMPDTILQKIDTLALQNNHDRTAEINTALTHWIGIGGTVGNETVTQQKIAELEEQLTVMSSRLQKQEEAIIQLSETLEKFEGNTSRLLSIIENKDQTMQYLLEKFSRE